MKPQYSAPSQQAKLSVSYLASTSANCLVMQQNNMNTCSPRAFLLHQPPGTSPSTLHGRSSGVPRYLGDRLRLLRSCSAKLATQPRSSVRAGSSLLRRGDQLRVITSRHEWSNSSVQAKFFNRDPDPPGESPWSSMFSNNSQTRIVPFTTRLADDPIGKEAEREATIIRRYQICH